MDERRPRIAHWSLVHISTRILGCLLLATILTCTIVFNGWYALRSNVAVENRFVQPITSNSSGSRTYMSNNSEDVSVASGDNSQKTRKNNVIKTILSYTPMFWRLGKLKDFSHCKVKQCRLIASIDIETVRHADVLMFQARNIKEFPQVNSAERSRQLWVLYNRESPGYSHNRWGKKLNNKFNVTMTYKPNGYLQAPYGSTHKLTTSPSSNDQSTYEKVLSKVKQKSKGAFAYVSHCGGVGYNRTKLMMQLSKHVNVDIYGKCTGVVPCNRGDYGCEERLHADYKFYLSFENSLCKDYITEKFWIRLNSSVLLVPVVMGGLSINDYTDVAPPDSFLHVYNFTSIKDLGLYMKELMDDTEKYMNYHKWRDNYRIDDSFDLCGVCQLAHDGKHMDAIADISNQWDFNSCKVYKH